MGDISNGKSPARRGSRPHKSLKRRSLVAGDSTAPRVLTATDNKEMAASFLQYCAMCEKQITTPSNSILYCSEACRRKDSAKPLSASTLTSPYTEQSPSLSRPTLRIRMSSSTSPTTDYFTSSSRIPSDIHHAKSDLDPTEWKPKLAHRGASEAFRYLSRFHQTMMMDNNDSSSRTHHKSSASLSVTTTPSLGNTPTTVASSFDSAYHHGVGSFNLRPLPPRQNPMYSTSAGNTRGIDLVTPHIPPSLDATVAMSVPVTFDEDLWGKKIIVPGSTPRAGDVNGLGALFGKES